MEAAEEWDARTRGDDVVLLPANIADKKDTERAADESASKALTLTMPGLELSMNWM